jgi:hypothetical protein
MKYLFLVFSLCLSIIVNAQKTLKVSVKNPLKTERSDQPVVLSLEKYGEVHSALVKCGE